MIATQTCLLLLPPAPLQHACWWHVSWHLCMQAQCCPGAECCWPLVPQAAGGCAAGRARAAQ